MAKVYQQRVQRRALAIWIAHLDTLPQRLETRLQATEAGNS